MTLIDGGPLVTNPKKDPENPKISINRVNLEDSAFNQPKSFRITIEKGKFATLGNKMKDYRKRIVFDKSPYPPESGWTELWKDGWLMEDGLRDSDNNPWEYKWFVGDYQRELNPTKVTIIKPWHVVSS
jgi:hypothetical protein